MKWSDHRFKNKLLKNDKIDVNDQEGMVIIICCLLLEDIVIKVSFLRSVLHINMDHAISISIETFFGDKVTFFVFHINYYGLLRVLEFAMIDINFNNTVQRKHLCMYNWISVHRQSTKLNNVLRRLISALVESLSRMLSI